MLWTTARSSLLESINETDVTISSRIASRVESIKKSGERVVAGDVVARKSLEEMTLPLAEELERLAPYGAGNPRPVFATVGVDIDDIRSLRRGTLKARMRKGGTVREAVCFRAPEGLGGVLGGGGLLDVAYKAKPSEFRGRRSLSLQIVDARPSEGG